MSRIYKQNITDMGSLSNNILKLRPVVFNHIQDSEKCLTYGLIAEEVEKIFPDLVIYSPSGKIEAVNYEILSSLLLNEFKKLSERLNQLESKSRKKSPTTVKD